jgi:hypothetical protein
LPEFAAIRHAGALRSALEIADLRGFSPGQDVPDAAPAE